MAFKKWRRFTGEHGITTVSAEVPVVAVLTVVAEKVGRWNIVSATGALSLGEVESCVSHISHITEKTRGSDTRYHVMCNVQCVMCDAAMIWGGGGSVTRSHRDQIVFFKPWTTNMCWGCYGWGCGVFCGIVYGIPL